MISCSFPEHRNDVFVLGIEIAGNSLLDYKIITVSLTIRSFSGVMEWGNGGEQSTNV